MKTLILTVGLPRSGKSTWAKKQGCPIVNPDSIRLALHGQRFEPLAEPFVWAIAKTMVRALFLAGHTTIILDACNIIQQQRDQWWDKDKLWVRRYQMFDDDATTCIARAKKMGDEEIVPIIIKMAADYEPEPVNFLEKGE